MREAVSPGGWGSGIRRRAGEGCRLARYVRDPGACTRCAMCATSVMCSTCVPPLAGHHDDDDDDEQLRTAMMRKIQR